jgi:hypothetical protein
MSSGMLQHAVYYNHEDGGSMLLQSFHNYQQAALHPRKLQTGNKNSAEVL